MIKLNSYVAV